MKIARKSGNSGKGGPSMLIQTTQFGTVEFQPEDVLLFPRGLIGYEECRHWILTGDAENAALAWLISLSQPNLALAVVSPRRFVSDYQLRLQKRELEELDTSSLADAHVLVVVSLHDEMLTVNLRAPIVVNLECRIGKQVMTVDEQPLQHPVARISLDPSDAASRPIRLRKSA